MIYVYDTGTISLKGNYLIWDIYNFFALPLTAGCEIRSKQFVYGESRYTLFIWPRGHKGSGTEEWFGLFLYKYDAPGYGDSVQFSIATTVGNIRSCTVQCSENNLFRQERFMEWSDFLTLREKIVPSGVLTIVCRLFIENGHRSYKESCNNPRAFLYPVCDPSLKYQSGDYHSRYPFSDGTASFRTCSPESNVSTTYPAPGFNYGPPSTVSSFYSSSMFQNSWEYIPESMETRNSDFKMPHCAAVFTKGNALRSSYLRSLGIVNEKQSSRVVRKPAKDRPLKMTPKSTSIISKVSPNIKNSPRCPDNCKSTCSTNGISDGEDLAQLSKPSTSTGNFPKGLKVLSQHLRHLYLESKSFDLIINMGGKEFKVLKAILQARSPVFDKLFSTDVAGNTSNIVSIDPFDACDSTAFHHFLLYVYSGEIENLYEKNLYGLYCSACKFEMADLKEECMKLLQITFSVDTIIDIFQSANTNDSEWWKVDVAVDFLARNMEIIMQTDEWKQFMSKEPDRSVEFQLKALKIGFEKK